MFSDMGEIYVKVSGVDLSKMNPMGFKGNAMRLTLPEHWKPRFLSIGAAVFMVGWLAPALASSFPQISLRELPDPLRSVWFELKPEMTPMSHCATAFDSHTDGDRMVFRCSIHIKMSAEGERRAMRYCEEKRAEKNIKMPCKLVVE